jgi:hypothetical protein
LRWAADDEKAERVVEWFAPVGIGKEHDAVLVTAVKDGRALGVAVRIFRVPD